AQLAPAGQHPAFDAKPPAGEPGPGKGEHEAEAPGHRQPGEIAKLRQVRCNHASRVSSAARECAVILTARSGAGLLGPGVGMISIASPRAIAEPDATAAGTRGGPALCVIVPTVNERDNGDILIQH